jgi:hypothetical protein
MQATQRSPATSARRGREARLAAARRDSNAGQTTFSQRRDFRIMGTQEDPGIVGLGRPDGF